MDNLVNKKVLVLYAGGTIGMTRETPDDPWRPDRLDPLLKNIPQLHQLPYDVVYEEFYLKKNTPIDSSNANYPLFNAFAKKIAREYKRYDGFVVIYGTDTMAPSAAALSYLLEGLGKPVVFTGSMIPAVEPRSDGPENVIDAIRVAGESGSTIPPINEVLIVFHGKILRAVTVEKYSAKKKDAFYNLPGHKLFGEIVDDGTIRVETPSPKQETWRGNTLRTHTLAIDSTPAFITGNMMEDDAFRHFALKCLGAHPKGVVLNGINLHKLLPVLQEIIPKGIPVFYAETNTPPDPSWAKLDGLNDFQQAMIKAAYAINRTDNPELAKALFAANIRGEGFGPIVAETEILGKKESALEQRSEFDTR